MGKFFSASSLRERPGRAFFLLASLANLDAFLGPYQPPWVHDVLDSGVSLARAGAALFRGGLHAWDPSLLCGSPLAVKGYGLLYPMVLWLGLFPAWLVCGAAAVLLSFLSGWGMHRYLSRSCRFSPAASFYGGLFFTCLNVAQGRNLFEVLVYLFPLYLYLFDRLVLSSGRERRLSLAALGVLLAHGLFFTTVPFFPLAHLCLILSPASSGDRRKSLAWFSLVWGLYALTQAPAMYATAAEAAGSQRLEWRGVGGYHDASLAGAFLAAFRELWGGATGTDVLFMAVPALFLLASLRSPRDRRVLFWWAFGAAVQVLIIVTGTSAAARWREGLGGLGSFQFVRFRLLFPFIFAFLSSAGLEAARARWGAAARPGRLWAGALAGLVLCAGLYAMASSVSRRGARGSFHFYFTNPAADRVREEMDPASPFRAAMMGTFHPSYLQYRGLDTADGYTNIYPARYKRFWEAVIGKSVAGTKWERYFEEWGGRVYLFSEYPEGKARADFQFEDVKFDLDLLRLANVQYLFSRYPVRRPEAFGLRLHSPPDPGDLARFRAAVLLERATPWRRAVRVSWDAWFRTSAPWWVYELEGALPRAYVAADPPSGGRQAARVAYRGPDRVEVSGSSGGGLLVLSDSYHRHWRATVNGRPSSVLLAEGVFRGVRVPAGEFTAEFRYEDRALRWLYLLSLLGLAGFAAPALTGLSSRHTLRLEHSKR